MAVFDARKLHALQKELSDLDKRHCDEMSILISGLRSHSPALFQSEIEKIRVTRMRHQEEHGAVIQKIQSLFRGEPVSVGTDDPIDGSHQFTRGML